MTTFRVEGLSQPPDDDAFDRQRQIAWWSQERVEGARILVVGAGAVGNEVLKNLVLLGVGYILVLDFDSIATSNLSRTVLFRLGDEGKNKAQIAAQRLLEMRLNPATTVEYSNADVAWDIGHGVFSRVDLVLGCVDNAEARLALNRSCFQAGTIWIDAGIHELAWHVAAYEPGVSACYACNVTPAQLEDARRRYSCDAVRRAFVASGRTPTVQVASALVAALQTQEALKILCGEHAATGEKLFFQGTVNSLDSFALGTNPACPLHVDSVRAITSPIGRSVSVGDFLRWSSDTFGESCSLQLTGLRWSFIHSVACGACGRRVVVDCPNYRLLETDCFCSSCNPIPARKHGLDAAYLTEISAESPLDMLNFTLAGLGFPLAAVVPVGRRGGDIELVELTGDIPLIFPGLWRFHQSSRVEQL